MGDGREDFAKSNFFLPICSSRTRSVVVVVALIRHSSFFSVAKDLTYVSVVDW